MSEPLNGQLAQAGPTLNAVWYTILAPSPVLGPGGEANMVVIGAHATLAEATAHVSRVPGGSIVANVLLFTNPQKVVAAKPNPGKITTP